jgi:hypothetical protein
VTSFEGPTISRCTLQTTEADTLSGPAGPARSWTLPVATLAVYAGLAIVLFGAALTRIGSAWIGDDRDPHLFIWYLGWTAHQLAALHSPFLTDVLQYPGGANLLWNTAVFAPAAALWPVTAAFGPIVAYNVMATAAVVLSAWCAALAARRLVASDLGAAVAGLVYGFSPYMVAQSLRHPHVTLAMFPPLALILLHEVLVRQRWLGSDELGDGLSGPRPAVGRSAVPSSDVKQKLTSTGRRGRTRAVGRRGRRALAAGAALGVASAVQLLTGEEILALTVLLSGAGVALLAVLHPREAAAGARRLLPALGVAAACFAVLAGYPLAVQFLGPLRVSGLLQPPNVYVTDLAAFVVPPSPMALSGGASAAVTGAFTGNVSENDAYVGVPLILLLVVATVMGRRRPLVRWAAPMTVLAALLSMGPRLHVAGHVTSIPLPWAVVGHLPLFESAVPSRLMLLAFLGVALLLADLVSAAARAAPRRRAAWCAAIAVALVPLVPRWPYPSTEARVPAFFQPGGAAAHLAPGSVVLVTPFSNHLSSVAMLWQATAGYTFRMPEGEAFVPGPSLGPPPSHLQATLTALDRGEAVPSSPEDRALTLRELSALGVETIVAGPSAGHDGTVRYLTSVLGRSPVRSGDVDVWRGVPGPAAPPP